MSFQISRKTSTSASIEWIVNNIIVRNDVNLIDGRKSSGKSAVIAAILGDWHNDKTLPNSHKLRNILWLSHEEPFDATIKPRLIQYGIDAQQVTTIDYRNGQSRKPVLPMDVAAMCDFMKDHDVNALVVDPFSELKPVDWSINDGDQMRSYMTAFVAICSRLSCTAFLPRHMRKSSGSFSGDDGMGSVQIKASIRHPLRIDVTEEKEQRRWITVQESNIAPPSLPLRFDFIQQPGHFGKLKWMGHEDIGIDEIKKLAESKVKRMKFEEAKKLLIEALQKGAETANNLIQEAKDNGIGERTLDDAKAELKIRSYRIKEETEKQGHWMWELPEELIASKTTIKGEPEMQQTLEDLPEAASIPQPELRKLTDEELDVVIGGAGYESDPIAADIDAQDRARAMRKPKTKATRKPSATKKPKSTPKPKAAKKQASK